MTECITQMGFSFHEKSRVVADFSGGEITSDAGLLVLRELDERLGWSKTTAAELVDRRDPDKVQHDTLTLLRQRLFALAAGYEDANDHNRLRTDPALKLVCNRTIKDDRDLASQPTLSRFENAVTDEQIARLNHLLVRQYIQLHKDHPPEEIIFDVDPTDDPCHGHQQLALFNGFYDQYMYLPTLVFERESGLLVGLRLRPGNVHPAHEVVEVLGPIVDTLGEVFPDSRIVIRADAGHAVPKLYEFCEGRGLGYIIGIGGNRVLKEETDWALSWLRQRFEKTGESSRWIGGFLYRAGAWNRRRRILYKVEVNAQGTNRRFLVTNLKGLPVHLYPVYNDRGTVETYIDQLKNQLSCDRLS